jgi:hypothetical protein
LGGKSPNIFFEDVMAADDSFLDKATEGLVLYVFSSGAKDAFEDTSARTGRDRRALVLVMVRGFADDKGNSSARSDGTRRVGPCDRALAVVRGRSARRLMIVCARRGSRHVFNPACQPLLAHADHADTPFHGK